MAFAGLIAANNLSDVANIEATWDNIGENITPTLSPPAGLTVEIFDISITNNNFEGIFFSMLPGNLRATNIETEINFINPSGYDVANGGTGNFFAIRAKGQIKADRDGANTYAIRTDDGVRVQINGVEVLKKWYGQAPTWYTFAASGLTGGQFYNIEIEYFQAQGDATLIFANGINGDPVTALRAGTGFSVKGADILALIGVSRLSARDLLLLNGLTTNVQVNLNTASQQIASGIVLQNNALLKASPTSIGNYSLNLNLVAQSLRINNIPVKSLATTPFSGATATVPILLDDAIVTNVFTMQNAISSGIVNSPDIAIPVRDGNYIYYLKAGQS